MSDDDYPYRPTQYLSGEEIRAGDRIRLAGEDGVVEFVLRADRCDGDQPADVAWFREQLGEGFMLRLERLGRVFQHEGDEDLEFCGRAESPNGGEPPA